MPVDSSVPQCNANANKQHRKREESMKNMANRQPHHYRTKNEEHMQTKTIEVSWQVRLQIQPHENANNNYS